MHVTRVELENIKSYKHAKFDFDRGTIAITGENGAGKTTIIEAIAWALFDTLDYKQDDFIKRGAKKGYVRVTFQVPYENGSDGRRQYTVYRDTGQGYYIFDHDQQAKVADKKRDVSEKLREILNVEAGTDLKELFRHAIGVPQGLFTTDFLLRPEERRKSFDKLLKVEDYREASDRLLNTVNSIKEDKEKVAKRIAEAEGQLVSYDGKKAEHEEVAAGVLQLRTDLAELQAEIAQRRSVLDGMELAERRVTEKNNLANQREVERKATERRRNEALTKRDEVQAAVDEQRVCKAGHEAYISACNELDALDRQRVERDNLRNEETSLKQQVSAAEGRVNSAEKAVNSSVQAAVSLASLEEDIARQDALDSTLTSLRGKYATSLSKRDQLAPLDTEIDRLTAQRTPIQQRLGETEAGRGTQSLVEQLQILEKHFDLQIAADGTQTATLETQRENVRSLLTDERRLQAAREATLSSLDRGIAALPEPARNNLSQLVHQLVTIDSDLMNLREDVSRYAEHLSLLQRLNDIAHNIQLKNDERADVAAEADQASSHKSAIEEIEEQLRVLNNPRERAIAIRAEADSESSRREQLAVEQSALNKLRDQLQPLVKQLEKYGQLDAQLVAARAQRDETKDAYRRYTENESLARTLPARQKEFGEAEADASRAKREAECAQEDYSLALKAYDTEKHSTENAAYNGAIAQEASISATLSGKEGRESELVSEIAQLEIIRNQKQEDEREKADLDEVLDGTEFIRDTLKDAAPRVAASYLSHISVEANQFFREITSGTGRTLSWWGDYEVILEEGGYRRTFKNLSGGEQMAAALSVRLALLTQLSDIRLAFFDEPTVNMDEKRCDGLAQQIGEIQNFDQLFIISHDDAFEVAAGSIVRVPDDGRLERESAEAG